MVVVEFYLDFFPLKIINLDLCAFSGCYAGSLFDLKYHSVCFLTYNISMGKILSNLVVLCSHMLKGINACIRNAVQVCQLCRFVLAKTLLSWLLS